MMALSIAGMTSLPVLIPSISSSTARAISSGVISSIWRKVVIVSKRSLLDGASNWAQGGIAAVLDSHDSHEQHIADTLVAGSAIFGADDYAEVIARMRAAGSV